MRKFRLRNNMIVEERPTDKSIRDGDYIDEYTIVDLGVEPPEGYARSERLVLKLFGGGFPLGGAHGEEFDIVEEL